MTPTTTWKERVIEEAKELAIKIDKLQSFIDNPESKTKVSILQMSYMHIQLDAMKTYHRILKARLS